MRKAVPNRQQTLVLMEQYIRPDNTINVAAFRKDHPKEYNHLRYFFGSIGEAISLLGCETMRTRALPLDVLRRISVCKTWLHEWSY